MFLARPPRDQCSSVPKSVQQSRAKVAHGLFTFAASFPHFATSDALATAQYHESADSDRITNVRECEQLSASAERDGLVASMRSSKKNGGLIWLPLSRGRENFCLLSIMRDEQSPIGEATASSVTTVDLTDMRALISRKTVFRHGAARCLNSPVYADLPIFFYNQDLGRLLRFPSMRTGCGARSGREQRCRSDGRGFPRTSSTGRPDELQIRSLPRSSRATSRAGRTHPSERRRHKPNLGGGSRGRFVPLTMHKGDAGRTRFGVVRLRVSTAEPLREEVADTKGGRSSWPLPESTGNSDSERPALSRIRAYSSSN